MDINLAEQNYYQPQYYTPEPLPEKKNIFRKFLWPIIIVAILAGGSGYYFLYYQKHTTPPDTATDEVGALLAQIGKLIVLPTNETPTIATVSDPDKLKNQAFFANAKKGDKVLIYSNNKKAILYDPVANKIIEVAPINLGTEVLPSPTPLVSNSPTPTK